MFDTNKVKVGSLVVTKDNKVGYITGIHSGLGISLHEFISLYGRYINDRENVFEFDGLAEDLNKDFKQIGTYIFEDKTIEPLEWGKYELTGDIWDCVRVANDKPPTTEQITDKINEIINWINRHSEGDR